MSDRATHNECTTRFIDLANQMAAEGKESQLISAALMAASGIYATFVAPGNEGGLEPGGVDKVVDMYRRNLEHIQKRKRQELEQKAGNAAPGTD